MKYLVLLIVLVIAVGMWRSRREPATPARAAPKPPRQPQDMVACAHCGLHLPQSDAILQHGMHYCCADHLRNGPAPRP